MNYGKKKYGLLIIVTLLLVSIGYALINTTLNIGGSSKIKQARWNIYFDKVANESGVESTETKIDSKKTTVSFDIDLEKPGDYYQFNVDTVNDGTIDAIIDSTELTGLTETTKEIIDYTVTYADGSSVNKCDTLNSGDRKTLLVKVNHFKDITEDELLEQAENLKLKFKINYVQIGACSREPILEIDPNGGKYNESRKITKQNVTKNTSITIPEATRDGYNFINWKTSSGVDLEKDSETKLTTINVGTSDIKVIAQWEKAIDPSLIKHTITIDPNGGLYDGSENTVTYQKKKNETVEVSTNIEREGYTFTGWVLEPINSTFVNNVLTVGTRDVTLTAGWQLNENEVVAKIGTTYYVTLQKAFNAAVTGDKIELLKDITEVSTNNKEGVFLDLGGHTITGTINNSGNLQVDNGKIQNLTENQSPIVNTGTIIIGTNDERVIQDSIILYGKTTGLLQNGQFYFYDGYIEGDIAFKGGYNGCATGYIVYVDHDNVLNCQKAYLALTPENAVAKVKSYNESNQTEPQLYLYFFSLKDAIDVTTNDNPDVYALKNFETSEDITIRNNQILNINLEGYTIKEGANVVNNGTFTIKDTATGRGTFSTAIAIKNNNTFNISNSNIIQSSNTDNTIENNGNINVINSNISAINKYALYNKSAGTLTFDNNTTFTTTSGYALYNDSTDEVNIVGGSFTGIHNKGNNLIVNGSTITNNKIYNETGTITLKNVNATISGYVLDNGGIANVESGTYESTGSSYTFNNSSSSAVINITGGTIKGSGNDTIYLSSGTLNVSGNTTNISNTGSNSAIYIRGGVCNIKGGNISSNGRGILQRSGTLNINGGNISNTSTYNSAIDIWSGPVNITGGEIISYNHSAIEDDSNGLCNIKGGLIKGKTYGVYVTASSAIVNVGINDDDVDPDLPDYKPVIMGDTYGIYKSNGAVNFYDGIIKGKNSDVYYGGISEIADGTQIVKGTEEIDETTYYTAYLYKQEDFLQVGSNTYNSLKKAINAISDTGTIKVIRDGYVSSPATISSVKDITLDLNGNQIISSVVITNEGKLTIEDNSRDDGTGRKGKFENNTSNIIENKKTLIINNGNFVSKDYIIYQKDNSSATTYIKDGNFIGNIYISSGIMNIDDGDFTSSSTYTIRVTSNYDNQIKNATIKNSNNNGYAVYNLGKLTLDNVTINDSVNGIYADHETRGYSMTTILKNSNVTVTNYGVYNYESDSFTINNCTINSDNTAIYNDYADLIVESGNITGKTYGIYNRTSSYSSTIKGGTIKSDNIAIYSLNGTVIIGNNSDAVTADSTNPIIIGDQYGVYLRDSDSLLYFYDGIIKSKGTQIYGIVTTTPDEYIVGNGVDSEDENYKTSYLVKQTPFIKVGTKTYCSLQKAINEAGTNGSMQLIGNGAVTSDSTIANTQDISLDLNGYTMITTKSITNNGTFKLEDNSSNQEGMIINNSNSNQILINNNNLSIMSGTYDAKGNVVKQNTGSIATIQGGYLKVNSASTIIDNNGTLNITGGTIDCGTYNNSYAINSTYGTLKITGGTIGNENSNVTAIIYIDYNNKLEIDENANIIAGNSYGISGLYHNNSNIIIRGGTVYSNSKDAININGINVDIYGGAIKSDSDTALAVNGTYSSTSNINIIGGKLEGKRYGLYQASGVITTIGSNDSEIELVPIIKGGTYGLYVNSGTVKFYDGILKGKTDGYFGNITETATNTTIGNGVETDSETGDIYKTRFLETQTEFVMNKTKTGTPKYSNLQLAIDEASTGDELQLIANASIYDSITFPDKTLKLDLNNYNISMTNQITNNGTVTIIDENTSGEKGKISTIGTFDLIVNNKKLIVNNASFENNYEDYYIFKNSASSTLDLTNVNINAKKGISNNTNSILNMNNTNIVTNNYSVNNYGGTISITDGDLICNNSGNTILTSSSSSNPGNITIRDSSIKTNSLSPTLYISGYDTVNLYNTTTEGSISINEGSELLYDTGTLNGRIYNSGKMKINNINLINYNNSVISNEASLGKKVEILNSNITITNLKGNAIENDGNVEIKNTNITLSTTGSAKAIYNSGSGKFKFIGGALNLASESTIGNIYGVYNESSSTDNIVNPDSIKVHGSSGAYGIYNTSGTLVLISSDVDVYDATNSYGIYQTGGEIILGTYDGSGLYSADVSTTTPFIKAVGQTSGIGAKRTDGTFRFFDGKIMGSTYAKPEAPTQIEPNYIVQSYTDTTSGFEYVVLECLSQKGESDIVDWSVKVNDNDTIKERTFSVDDVVWKDTDGNTLSQLQYGAIGNITIKIDGTSMTNNFKYKIIVSMADNSPITVSNNNIEEIMDISQETEKSYAIVLNCSSPTADYTTIDKSIPITITIERIEE